jgi:RNA binding exosome subunit
MEWKSDVTAILRVMNPLRIAISIYIHHTDDPVKMWETLRENLETITSFIGRAAIGTKTKP